MKFSQCLIVIAFLVMLLTTASHTNAQSKRFIGRINEKKLYVASQWYNFMSGHYYTNLFILYDSSVGSKEFKLFEGYEDGNPWNPYPDRILQAFGGYTDQDVFLDEIIFEQTDEQIRLIVPFNFSDARFGSENSKITRFFKWNEEKNQFDLENEVSVDSFHERMAKVQRLLFLGKYNEALSMVRDPAFYEKWDAYPGDCNNYFYPQNLFLELIDHSHKYALQKLNTRDTIVAAKLVNDLLGAPIFRLRNEYDKLIVLPFLRSTNKRDQYGINSINPCHYVSNWECPSCWEEDCGCDQDITPDWMFDFKNAGYVISFRDSIEMADRNNVSKKLPGFYFIPNDPEYTVKFNDLAYVLEVGGYDSLAATMLKQVVRHHPRRTVAFLNLADALYDLGEVARAKVTYESYVALCQKNKLEAKIPKRVWDRVKYSR